LRVLDLAVLSSRGGVSLMTTLGIFSREGFVGEQISEISGSGRGDRRGKSEQARPTSNQNRRTTNPTNSTIARHLPATAHTSRESLSHVQLATARVIGPSIPLFQPASHLDHLVFKPPLGPSLEIHLYLGYQRPKMSITGFPILWRQENLGRCRNRSCKNSKDNIMG